MVAQLQGRVFGCEEVESSGSPRWQAVLSQGGELVAIDVFRSDRAEVYEAHKGEEVSVRVRIEARFGRVQVVDWPDRGK